MTVYQILERKMKGKKEEVARFLCSLTECKNCIARDFCHMGYNGFIDFLELDEDEAEDMWR